MSSSRPTLGRRLASLFSPRFLIGSIGSICVLVVLVVFHPRARAVEGTLNVTATTASYSGTMTQAGNQPIRTAFGPLRLDYKSGPNSWTTGLLMREGDGNVTVGAGITSADFNSASKLRVLGVVESTTGGFKFPDGTTQTTAASAAVGGGWTDGGTNVYLTTGTDSVGIGTTAPATGLEVKSDTGLRVTRASNSDQIITLTGGEGTGYSSVTAGYGLRLNAAKAAGLLGTIELQSAGATKVFMDASGNVGIGTTGPFGALTLGGTNGDATKGLNFEANTNLGAEADASRRWRIRADYTAYGDLAIAQSTTRTGVVFDSKVMIGATGNVGIGSTTPGAKLEVAGNINSSTGALQTAGVTRIDNSGVGTLAAGTTIGGSGIPGGSGLNSVQTFSSSGTWTKPTGVTKVIIEVQGGGGGGGGGNGPYDGAIAGGAGGSGGAGGYCRKFIDVSAISTVAVTVGTGGNSGAAGYNGQVSGSGGNGNTSSFGAHCSATGGTGGGPGIRAYSGGSGGGRGSGGTGSGGDINLTGNVGFPGKSQGNGGTEGGTGLKGTIGGDGGDGGAGSWSSWGGAGVAGTTGIVVVWEYK